MQIHYINLERRKDRNERFLAMNSPVAEFRRIDAIDGGYVDRDELAREGVIRSPLTMYSPGALGNALSHRKMWQLAAASDAPLTVAEDDAVLNRRFVSKAQRVLGVLPSDWDIIFWGWNFDAQFCVQIIEGIKNATMRFDSSKLGPRVSEFQDKDYEVAPLRVITAFGVVCYSVSPKGGQRLLEECFPLTDEMIRVVGLRWALRRSTIDAVMSQHSGALRSYVAFPPLAWTENDWNVSDVYPRASWQARLEWLFSRTLGRWFGMF